MLQIVAINKIVTTFLPSPLHWARGCGFEPQDRQSFSTQISILKVDVLPYMLNFQSNHLSMLFLPWNTVVNFFPFCHLPLPSYGKNHITPISHWFYPISLSYTKKYTKDTKPLPIQFETQIINPLFAITSAGSILIMLRSSVCWLKLQLDKWSVVQPTRLPTSNYEASLRGHERLKGHLQESG